MNMPAPTPNRTIGSSAAAATSSSGTTPRELPSAAGTAFDKILSGLGTAANAPAKPTAAAKPVAATQPVPPGVAATPANQASFHPHDPATPARADPAQDSVQDVAPGPIQDLVPDTGHLVPAMTTKASSSHTTPAAAPAPTAPGKPTDKIRTATAKNTATDQPDPTPPQALVPGGPPIPIPAPAAPAPVALALGAAKERELAPAAARAPLDLAAPHDAGALLDQSATPGGLPALPAAAAAPPDMTTSTLLSAGLTPAAAPASVAAPSTAMASRPATSPADQLEPALVQVGQAAGSHHITVRLDPLELGSVAIRIDRGDDGTAAVQVTVERPDTLRMLLGDQQQLHRALDAAGLPQDGRTVTVSLATPDPSTTGGASGGASGGLGDGSGTANPGNGGFGGQRDRQGQRASRAVPLAGLVNSSSGWQRAGVDITA